MGERKDTFEVKECSHYVLSTIIDFMYGIPLPETMSLEDLCSVLYMADLYLMKVLKDNVAPLFGDRLEIGNILEISSLAEDHRALHLKDLCCKFILDNIDSFSTNLLDKLFAALPSVGNASLHELKIHTIAKKFPGVHLQIGIFKKRADFSSDQEYVNYVRAHIKPNMVVRSPAGVLGRVARVSYDSVLVQYYTRDTDEIDIAKIKFLA